jgi:RNA polymerase sigma-70 factor (ECF subfamily)
MTSVTSSSDASFWTAVGAETAWIHRQLRRLGVRPADLDDEAQEVLVDVFRKWPQFDSTRALRPWLYGFIVNTVGDYRRRPHHRRESLEEPAEAVDHAPLAEDRIADAQAREIVLEALEAVEFGRRTVFVLSEFDEVPMNEVAQSLSIPVNTAYSRLRLARKEFADAVHRIKLRRGIQ